MNGQPYIITLCHICRANFDKTGAYIHRADPTQKDKERCTYCNVRDGYDYKVTPKGRRDKR